MNWRSTTLLICGLCGAARPIVAAFELDDAEVSFPNPIGFGGNPATLARLKCRRWATDHYVPFTLRQLSSTGITAAIGFAGRVGAGLGLRSSGFSLHRETSSWFGLGYVLRDDLDLGLSVTAQELRQPNLRRRYLGFAPGIRVHLRQGVEVSVWYQQRSSEIPSKLFLGIRRRLDAVSRVSAQWRYSTAAPARLDATVEQQLHPRLSLLLGLRTRPRRFAAGAVIVLGGRYLSIATVTHPYLGLSPAIGMGNTCRAP